MTTYYVDPNASGTNDGGGDGTDRTDPTEAANWTNAWTSLAAAIAGTNGTAPAAGDVVYCKHTDTPDELLGAGITQSLDGSSTARIQWIGVNSSGVNDGTHYIIDGGGTNTGSLLTFSGGVNWFENFKIHDSDNAGCYITGTDNVFVNCWANESDWGGFQAATNYNIFVLCKSTSNGWYGFNIAAESSMLFCVAQANGLEGFNAVSVSNVLYGCLAHDNSQEGFNLEHRSNRIINCVSDDNTYDGILADEWNSLIIGNRLTNNAEYGIDFITEARVVVGWNYAPGAGQGRANTSGATNGLPVLISDLGNIWNGTDTDGGYNAPTTDDFSLVGTATLRRTAIELP